MVLDLSRIVLTFPDLSTKPSLSFWMKILKSLQNMKCYKLLELEIPSFPNVFWNQT